MTLKKKWPSRLKKRQKRSSNTAKIVRIDPLTPDPDDIRLASDILGQKGVLVFPTTGLYGLGADARSADAVRRVFAIKRRPPQQPVLVLLSGIDDITTLVRAVPDYARPLLRIWPGGLTLVFRAADSVPSVLTGGTGRIGVRLPAHPVARALAGQFGGPITGTSANLSGGPSPARVTDLAPEVCRQTDLVLDAGTLAGGPGSTILDATCWPVEILREGAVRRKAIDAVLRDG
jgi:L-threonylcarbamoyladenylate synthase